MHRPILASPKEIALLEFFPVHLLRPGYSPSGNVRRHLWPWAGMCNYSCLQAVKYFRSLLALSKWLCSTGITLYSVSHFVIRPVSDLFVGNLRNIYVLGCWSLDTVRVRLRGKVRVVGFFYI